MESAVDRLLPSIISEVLGFVVGEYGLSYDVCDPLETIIKYKLHKMMRHGDYVEVYRTSGDIHINIRLNGEERVYVAQYTTTIKLTKQK